MGGMKEYNRGYRSGYSSMGSRIPRTFVESVGFQAGKAQRERETAARRPSGAGEASAGGGGLPLRAMLVIGGLGLLGLVLVSSGGGRKFIAMLAGVVAVAMVRRVRRVLGVATPVYVGVMVGFILGCMESMATGSRLNLSNLGIFLFLGASVGAVFVPLALVRRGKRRES